MLRKHENSVSWKAGLLSATVHAALLAALLISFNWKAAHTVLNVTEVELWDNVPIQANSKPLEIVEPKPEPLIKEPPAPEPPKPVVEEKPQPEAPKVDIELENKKLLEEKKREEKRKKEATLEKIKQAAREEDLEEKHATQKNDDALKKLQQEALNENNATENQQASAANASLTNEFKAKIQAKIRGNVNKTLCGDGNPELKFEIGLLPTGELTGSPKITKSSGNSACDEAVERAIIASEPLPLPSDPGLFSSFRKLNLTFRPNDN
ncbi:MAG: energy transducer TonB [Methylophilaceae bacterium]